MDPFPPTPKARPRSLGPIWIGILLAVIAVGGVGYWIYQELAPVPGARTATEAPASRGMTPAERPAEPTATPQAAPPPAAEGRSDTILTCTAVNGEIFYTNATRCEDADINNRINVMDAGPRPPVQASTVRDCLGAQPEPRVQQFLAVCMEPFNEALKLERFLLESDDPVSSRTAQRYCNYITEGVQAGCMATSAQFCFLDLCQELRESQ